MPSAGCWACRLLGQVGKQMLSLSTVTEGGREDPENGKEKWQLLVLEELYETQSFHQQMRQNEWKH